MSATKRAERFLVSRYRARNPHFYDVILEWTETRAPEARARFEIWTLPFRAPDTTHCVLHVPWFQDPIQEWSMRTYEEILRVTAGLDQRGIPTINRVDRLLNASKSNGARLMGGAGVRTARTIPIDDADLFKETFCGLELPLLVREDWGHADALALRRGVIVRCNTRDEVHRVELGRFRRPVAVEFVETRDPRDGAYRKYRYVAAGERGVPHHLQAKDHWFVKGRGQLFSDALREEELVYLSSADPNHDVLQSARRALGLDFVAFDYSYDRDGRIVVWEANPYPHIHFLPGRRAYRRPAVERTLAAILHLYHVRAGLTVPDALGELLE